MAMTEHVPHEDDEPDWVAIAQAEGVLSARERISVTEAATALRTRARARGVSVDKFARDLVRPMRSAPSDRA
jgi:AmiR/NasT family two-component response regulator